MIPAPRPEYRATSTELSKPGTQEAHEEHKPQGKYKTEAWGDISLF